SFLREPQDKLGFFASLGQIWNIYTLRILIFTNAAFGFSLFGVVFWIPTFFEREFGFSTEGAGAALAGLAAAGFIGTWFGRPFGDRNVAKGFAHDGNIGVYATLLLAATWSHAFILPSPAPCRLLLSARALLAWLDVRGPISLVALVSPPRIRS